MIRYFHLFFSSLIGNKIDFLAWRVWIGIWLFVLSLTVAAFQGSTLVKHVTKFTKDIFSALIALLFIFTAFNKLGKVFKSHPLEVSIIILNPTKRFLISVDNIAFCFSLQLWQFRLSM